MARRGRRLFHALVGRLRPALGRSLWFKITLASAVLVLPLSGAFWYRSMESERRLLTEGAAEFAASFADLVRKSVREDMLRNDRDGVQRTVSSVSDSESLRSVRIYDRFGTVAFSSNALEVGRRAGRHDEPCAGCHEDPQRPRDTLHTDRRSAVVAGADGGRVLSYVEPIYNEHACATDACHAHDDGARVLGVLIAEFPLTRLDRRAERQVRDFSVFIGVYLVALATSGYLILWLLVLVPVNAVSEGVERVAAGDLAQTVPVVSADEIGRLAANFNAMTMELAASRRRMERLTHGLEEQLGAKAAEVRRTEGRLAEAERLAALGRLTAEIAHEIRNPLTALGGYGRRLLRTVSLEGERECARIVVEEAARLERLLKDVLDFSRPARYELAPHGLEGIVRDSLAAFGERCRERGIVVESEMAAGEPVCIDPEQVRRAVDNLVANAVDAMPDGGTLSVGTRLGAARCLTFVVLQVEDTGPGIPEEDLLRIFEPFWTTKKVGEGTGLGLPITRKIVEAHGGFVDVVNRPGGGLSASLWFPQADAVPPGRPCWEAVRCGREGADSPEPCPAWPHFGRSCWAVAGTFGEGPPRCTMAARLRDCRECSFFKQTAGA
jgi:signal transduction histidine kinase